MKRICLASILALLLWGAACDRPVTRPGAASPRIVSHSPALTQLLIDMGLSEHIVGVTPYCPSPPDANVPVVGDLVRVNTEAILAADPDVVLVQQKPEDFKLLGEVDPDIRIEHFRIDRIGDIETAARRIGEIVNKPLVAEQAIVEFRRKLHSAKPVGASGPRPRVLFVMGTARPSVHAEGSFVDDLIEIAGGVNAANAIPGNQAWRRATLETIAAANVDVLVVQTAPAKAKHARKYWMQWEDIPAVRNGRVHIVTDDAWMRPTFKLADLAGELADMLYPDRAKGKATSEGKDLR